MFFFMPDQFLHKAINRCPDTFSILVRPWNATAPILLTEAWIQAERRKGDLPQVGRREA